MANSDPSQISRSDSQSEAPPAQRAPQPKSSRPNVALAACVSLAVGGFGGFGLRALTHPDRKETLVPVGPASSQESDPELERYLYAFQREFAVLKAIEKDLATMSKALEEGPKSKLLDDCYGASNLRSRAEDFKHSSVYFGRRAAALSEKVLDTIQSTFAVSILDSYWGSPPSEQAFRNIERWRNTFNIQNEKTVSAYERWAKALEAEMSDLQAAGDKQISNDRAQRASAIRFALERIPKP